MKKYKLRDQFSLVMGREVAVGPCEVEIDEETAAANQHKLEEIVAQAPVENKKPKGKKDEE